MRKEKKVNRLQLASIFQDGMVIQRDREIRIFGYGRKGSKLSVRLEILSKKKTKVLHKSVTIIEDRWEVNFPPAVSSTSANIKVTSGVEVCEVNEAVFGEVFIAAGQSNMQFMLKETFELEEALSTRESFDLRYYFTPRIAYEGEDKSLDAHGWHKASGDLFQQFSAVAYFFGKQISGYIDCPIGIIGCNWGGTSLFSWISEEEVLGIEETKGYIDSIYSELSGKSEKEYGHELIEYDNRLKEYDNKVGDFLIDHPLVSSNKPLDYYYQTKDIDYPWPPPMGNKSFLRPGALYENMVKEIAPFSLHGVLWYQGESDVELGSSYEVMLKTLLVSWRNLFRDKELFFFIVQLPVFRSTPHEDAGRILVRQAQFNVGTGDLYGEVCNIMDLGDVDNIHPFLKKEVGRRLGLLAGKYLYKEEDVAMGPVIHKMQMNNEGIRLTFINADKGIYANEGRVIGFAIEEEVETYDVIGEICGHDVLIPFGEIRNVEAIKAVTYAWGNEQGGSIRNWLKLPMYPFRCIDGLERIR